MAILGTLSGVGQWMISNMAAAKPEVAISQLPQQIAMKFQRLNNIFSVTEVNGHIGNTARCWPMTDIQHGGSQTGSSYVSASTTDRYEISKANPRFLR